MILHHIIWYCILLYYDVRYNTLAHLVYFSVPWKRPASNWCLIFWWLPGDHSQGLRCYMVRPAVSQQLVGVSRRDRVALKGLVACVRVTHLAVCADRSGCLQAAHHKAASSAHSQLLFMSCSTFDQSYPKTDHAQLLLNFRYAWSESWNV